MSTSNKFLYIIALVVLFSAGLLLAKYTPWTQQSAVNKGYTNLGGDFVLESLEGQVKLEDYRGKLVLMYFGFTLFKCII